MGAGYGWQYEILARPFCQKGSINCMRYPSPVSVKRNVTASLPGSGGLSKSKEVWIVKSGCESCSKTRNDVERELRKNGSIS